MPTNKTTIALLLDTETTGTSRNDQIIEYAHTLFRVDAVTNFLLITTGVFRGVQMDFMSDSLEDGRKLRTFNVLDDYNREALAIEVDVSLPSARIILVLEQVFEWRGKPEAIRCETKFGVAIMGLKISQRSSFNRQKNTLLRCYIFNLASLRRMRTLNDLIVPHATNGWIYICLKALSKLNTLPPNGYSFITMKDPIQRLAVFRQHN